jgi:hypothetical protein
MRTFRNILVAAGLAMAVVAGPVHLAYAGTSPTPPVNKCSDFACEQAHVTVVGTSPASPVAKCSDFACQE